jgi:hypothetical protein
MADKRTCQAIVKSTAKPCTNDASGGNGEFCGKHCKCTARNVLGLKCGDKVLPGFRLCQKHHQSKIVELGKQEQLAEEKRVAAAKAEQVAARARAEANAAKINGGKQAAALERKAKAKAACTEKAEAQAQKAAQEAFDRAAALSPVNHASRHKETVFVKFIEIPGPTKKKLQINPYTESPFPNKQKPSLHSLLGRSRKEGGSPFRLDDLSKAKEKLEAHLLQPTIAKVSDPRVQILQGDFYFAKLRLNTPERVAELMKRAGVPEDISLEVDHTYEVQLFTHALIQTPAFHGPLVKLLDGFSYDGKDYKWFSPTRTPAQFRKSPFADPLFDNNMICCFRPLYRMLNGEVDDKSGLPFNLRLLNEIVNKSKGNSSYSTFIRREQQGVKFSIFSDMNELYSGKRHTEVPFFNGSEDGADLAQKYCFAIGAQLKDTAGEFQESLDYGNHAVENATQASQKAHRDLSETIGSFVGYLEEDLKNLRIDK